MSRLKYGIDLGTTNSGLSRIVKGESKIVKNSSQQDTTPSCIGFTRKGGVQVGTKAFNQLKSDKIRALKSGTNSASNIFLEFKRAKSYRTTWYPSLPWSRPHNHHRHCS